MTEPTTLAEAAIACAKMDLEELLARQDRVSDQERDHSERDDILLELLDALVPEIALLARRAEDEGGYWYS